MKDTFYFSHDYNARTDVKIKRLIAKHGLTGYGLFWAIVEDLYNNANALPLDYVSIAYDLRTNEDLVKSVIHDFDLFVIEGETFGSVSVERRLNERNLKSKKAKESADLRWKRHREDANAMRTQYDGNAIKERKGKEIKESIEIQNNTQKGLKHFEHIKDFYSHPYSKQFDGFRKQHTQKEYEDFQKFLNAMFRDFTIQQLTANFDTCLGMGDWKKILKGKGFMIIKPALEKAIAAKEGNREQMALRIKTFMNGLLDEKVLTK